MELKHLKYAVFSMIHMIYVTKHNIYMEYTGGTPFRNT